MPSMSNNNRVAPDAAISAASGISNQWHRWALACQRRVRSEPATECGQQAGGLRPQLDPQSGRHAIDQGLGNQSVPEHQLKA